MISTDESLSQALLLAFHQNFLQVKKNEKEKLSEHID
jgi:hypothetical protein